jgi:hypothetical protein
MHNPDQKILPPWWIWLCVLLAAGCAGVGLYLAEQKNRRLETVSMETYLQNGTGSQNGEPLILVFGTSLSECGLDSTRTLETAIGEAFGKPVTVRKIWRHAATLASFDDITEIFKRLKPDCIVIEANMFFYKFPHDPLLSRYINTLREIVAFNKVEHAYFPDARLAYRSSSIAEVDSRRAGLIDTTAISSFRQTAAGWQREGSRLFLLNIPLESALETEKWNSPDTIVFRHNLDYFRKACSFKYIDPLFRLDSTYFFDHAHMNPKGQKKLSAFFCKTLADQLKTL